MASPDSPRLDHGTPKNTTPCRASGFCGMLPTLTTLLENGSSNGWAPYSDDSLCAPIQIYNFIPSLSNVEELMLTLDAPKPTHKSHILLLLPFRIGHTYSASLILTIEFNTAEMDC